VQSGRLTANVGSGRVLEKVGFRLVGRRKIRFGAKFGFQALEISQYELLRKDYRP
jgi:RimJ/RimL family protein N-acetyltransferase